MNYRGRHIPTETIIKGANTLVYVIDAQEDDYDGSLPDLVATINMVYQINPNIHFEVFLHKVDGDLMPEDIKAGKTRDPYYTLYNLHFTLYTIHYTLDTRHWTLDTRH